jgi:hypothetical protein
MQSPDIMKAKALNDHKMMLIFKNGEQKIFDMKPYLNYPAFKPLEDQSEFNQFDIVDGTVEWKCGADLSQDTFYLESVPASERVTI